MEPKDFAQLAEYGIISMNQGRHEWQTPLAARNFAAACDAQPSLITTSNSGIPAYLSTIWDPKVIDVVLQPMKAAKIVSAAGTEVKKGDWTSTAAEFPMIEYTGSIATYSDRSGAGTAGANMNWIARQSYLYQTVTQWGELELDRMGLAKVDWANKKSIASVLVLNKFQNASYFYGISGLKNYGLLNDPNLPASGTPSTKAAGGTTWAVGTAVEIYNDFVTMFTTLQTQSGGNIETTDPLVLALSPAVKAQLLRVSPSFYSGKTVETVLHENFPNLRIETAPEYATGSGNLVQLILENYEGQQTVDVAFTEKLRAHATVVDMSSFKQKKSQGTWGAIIYRPMFITSLLGV